MDSLDNNHPAAKATADSKTRILDVALRLFARHGYHKPSMEHIGQEAESDLSQVYFHFPSKEKLFLALVDQFAEMLERRVNQAITAEPVAIKRVQLAIEVCLRTFAEYRYPAKLLLVQAVGLGGSFEEKRLEVQARFARLIAQHLQQAVAAQELPLQTEPLDAEVVAMAWVGAIYGLMMQWLRQGEPAQERIISTLVPILLRSVGYVKQS